MLGELIGRGGEKRGIGPTNTQLLRARRTMYDQLPKYPAITGGELGTVLSEIDRVLEEERGINTAMQRQLRPKRSFAIYLPFHRKTVETANVQNAREVFRFLRGKPEIAYGIIGTNVDAAFTGMLQTQDRDYRSGRPNKR